MLGDVLDGLDTSIASKKRILDIRGEKICLYQIRDKMRIHANKLTS
jgi:hypothetical protein